MVLNPKCLTHTLKKSDLRKTAQFLLTFRTQKGCQKMLISWKMKKQQILTIEMLEKGITLLMVVYAVYVFLRPSDHVSDHISFLYYVHFVDLIYPEVKAARNVNNRKKRKINVTGYSEPVLTVRSHSQLVRYRCLIMALDIISRQRVQGTDDVAQCTFQRENVPRWVEVAA